VNNRQYHVEFVIHDWFLFQGYKLCIPTTSFRDFLVWEMHAGGLVGHLGKDRTIALVEDRFYWPSLKRDGYRIVSQCRTCLLAKTKRQNTRLYNLHPSLYHMHLGKTLAWTSYDACLRHLENLIRFLLWSIGSLKWPILSLVARLMMLPMLLS